jgi:hypothetical protein
VGPGGDSITVQHAVDHGCSVRPRVAAELDGIVLHRVAVSGAP